MKILLFSNGNPFFDAGGYNLQCRYLIQMMKQFKQQGWIGEYFGAFTSIPNLNYEKNPTPKLASQLIQSQGQTMKGINLAGGSGARYSRFRLRCMIVSDH